MINMQNRTRLLVGTAVAVLLGLTVSARADVTDQLLDRLKEKGILSKGEYHKFKERHAAEVQEGRERLHTASRTIVTKEGIKVIPIEDDIVRVIKVKDKGIGLRVGEVDLTLSGNINAFGAYDFSSSNRFGTPIFGGLTTGSRFLAGANGQSSSYASRNGLLPASFILNAATHQEGYDVGVTFGIYPGITLNNGPGANAAGTPGALASSGIDFRQIFATVGNSQIGTFKGGRDLGLFGSDAILNDFTIFGVGSPGAAGGNHAPSNTSLGRIGEGYVYADFLPQLTYVSNDYNGFTASFGVFQPLNEQALGGYSGNLTRHDQPQLQGKLKYAGDISPDAKLTAWVDGLTQDAKAGAFEALPNGRSIRVNAVDGGAKLDIGRLGLLAYGYYGDGLGTTGLLTDGVDPFGNKRKSYGGYGQVTYALTPRLTLAGSYGVSYLDRTAFDVGALVRKNESYIGAARYKLTTWVNLQGEYVHTTATSHAGNRSDEDTISAGTILFF
jgi:hypothetical protein